ncbi:MAG: adenylate/guanylate cyclase domain-containing protein [Bacteroidota bacterium]
MVRKYLHIILLGVVSLVPIGLLAQDSLTVMQLLEQAKEMEKVEEAKEKYEVSYALSRQLKYEKGLKATLPMLIDVELKQGNNTNALRYLLEESEMIKGDSNKKRAVDVNVQIGDLYKNEALYQQALPYYKTAEQLSQPNVSNDLMEKIGLSFSELNQPDSAAIYYKALMSTKTDDLDRMSNMRKIVEAYQKAGNYEAALDYNLQLKSAMEKSSEWEDQLGVIYNNLGYTNNFLGDYEDAIEWFHKAEGYMKKDKQQLSVIYTNLGVGYFNKGETKLAIQYLLKALALTDKDDKNAKGNINNLIANIYLQKEDYYNAQAYNRDAIRFANEGDDTELKSEVYETAADIHTKLYEYEQAIEAFQTHLTFRDSISLAQELEEQRLREERSALEKAEKEIKLLLIQGQVQDLTIEQLESDRQEQQLKIDNLNLVSQNAQKEIELMKVEEQTKETEMKNRELEAKQTQQMLLLAQRQLELQTQEQQLAQLAQAEALSKAELKLKQEELTKEEQRSALLQREQEIQQLELDAQKESIAQVQRLGGLLFLIILLVLAGLIYSRRVNKKLAQQKVEIEEEREKSESLLLNILPVSVAQELKEIGHAVPRRHETVSILFSDFVGFTKISARNTPEIIINELNDCFRGFDEIMEQEGIEKIQTIGDGYLAVAGLPEAHPQHAIKCVNAAKKMINFLHQRNLDTDIQWKVRIGIHTGPIMAGVVGTKKFAYSIFGDSVNTASRIETAGAEGRINVSANTYEFIKDHFDCEYRGKISAKGKGDLDMYFVS